MPARNPITGVNHSRRAQHAALQHADGVGGERVRRGREPQRRREEQVEAQPGEESDDRARLGAVVEGDGHRQHQAEIGHPSRQPHVREQRDLQRRRSTTTSATSRPSRIRRPAVDVVDEVVVERCRRRGRRCVVVVVAIGTTGPSPGTQRSTMTNSSASKSTYGLMRTTSPKPADCSSTCGDGPDREVGRVHAVREIRVTTMSPRMHVRVRVEVGHGQLAASAATLRDAGDRMLHVVRTAIADSGSVSTRTVPPPCHELTT